MNDLVQDTTEIVFFQKNPKDVKDEIASTILSPETSNLYKGNLEIWHQLIREDYPSLSEEDILPLPNARKRISTVLESGSQLAYWSGGFDLGINHLLIIYTLKYLLPPGISIVIGIEPDNYIQSKGRSPNFKQEQRLHTIALFLKNIGKLALALPIPERQSDVSEANFYNHLIDSLGLNKRKGCYHLFTKGDPAAQIKMARMHQPMPWCELPLIHIGEKPLSTTLQTKIDM
jgi:hypothetical protein